MNDFNDFRYNLKRICFSLLNIEILFENKPGKVRIQSTSSLLTVIEFDHPWHDGASKQPARNFLQY